MEGITLRIDGQFVGEKLIKFGMVLCGSGRGIWKDREHKINGSFYYERKGTDAQFRL